MQSPKNSKQYLKYLESIKINPKHIIAKHYIDYLEIIKTNPNLISQILSDMGIQGLRDKKYKLTEFDIYKYLNAYDHIRESLNCDRFTFTEGIEKDRYKYNNILVDLFYHNIPSNIIHHYPISIVFKIKQVWGTNHDIQDLSKAEIISKKDAMFWNPCSLFEDDMNFYKELENYRTFHSNYAGNSYTYYIFKQLIKLFLTEVYLYEYKGQVLTYKELLYSYQISLYNHSDPNQIKSIQELINSGDIKKIKYQCIKVSDPKYTDFQSISELNIHLLKVDKNMELVESLGSIIEKKFDYFWDNSSSQANEDFKEYLENLKAKKTR